MSYGKARATGSLGYAVTALLFGFVFARVDMQITFYLHLITTVICLVLILKTEGVAPSKDDRVVQLKKNNFGQDVLQLLKNRQYVVFVICAAMTFIGSSASISFLSSLLELRGGTAEHLGYALFAQAGFEVPFMLLSGKLLKRFNIKFLLVFAFFAYAVKYLAPALTTSVWGVIAVQSLQGISFGIFLPAAMKYIVLIAPVDLRNTATTLAVAVYGGVGNIAGNALGGIVADTMGVEQVYILAAILAIVSAVTFTMFGIDRRKADC